MVKTTIATARGSARPAARARAAPRRGLQPLDGGDPADGGGQGADQGDPDLYGGEEAVRVELEAQGGGRPGVAVLRQRPQARGAGDHPAISAPAKIALRRIRTPIRASSTTKPSSILRPLAPGAGPLEALDDGGGDQVAGDVEHRAAHVEDAVDARG